MDNQKSGLEILHWLEHAEMDEWCMLFGYQLTHKSGTRWVVQNVDQGTLDVYAPDSLQRKTMRWSELKICNVPKAPPVRTPPRHQIAKRQANT